MFIMRNRRVSTCHRMNLDPCDQIDEACSSMRNEHMRSVTLWHCAACVDEHLP
jgi:hypothetical protein